jgi:starch synthase
MHIIHLSSELAPIAKVGGLGDVVYGLSLELIKQGHTVEVILPKYDTIDYRWIKNLQVLEKELKSFDGPLKYNNTIWSGDVDGIKVLLVEPHHPAQFFSRGAIYGCADDVDRFLYFSRTSMEFIYKTKRKPDCIHLHDWPVAVASTLYKDMYIPLGMRIGGTLLTIHNVEHQGKCAPHNLTRIGLPGEKYLTPERYQDNIIPQVINLLKGGIEDATLITTVSPNYSQEILTQDFGHGLEKDLQRNKDKITGILNGIDPNFWNPETDPHLLQRYSALSMDKVFEAKESNRKQLSTHLGIEYSNAPLIGCITRLVPQKGPELIIHAIRRTIKQHGIFVLLGSEYSSETKTQFLDLKKELAESKSFGLLLDRDEPLAHLIFAASDFLIVPSIFEPCGLTQMIALRYGSIPIVRNTGGLADTVFDVNFSKLPQEKRNGFVFEDPTKKAMEAVIDRALSEKKNDPIKWKNIVQNALHYDFSWKQSIIKYIELYSSLKT